VRLLERTAQARQRFLNGICFKAGGVSVEDYECPEQPSTSKMTENFDELKDLINKDHH
jgi:hypothetical protein